MRLSDFDYRLPEGLIAQHPSKRRDESRLMVLHRHAGSIEHRRFKDISEYLGPDDALILNDTRVLPARLIGRKKTGGRVDVLLLNNRVLAGRRSLAREDSGLYEVLVKPSRGCGVGSEIFFGDGSLSCAVKDVKNGRRVVKFNIDRDIKDVLEEYGDMPLPPYIKREAIPSDRERYQTVYARRDGSVAAPTAGLHFTDELISSIVKGGTKVFFITLHVGYGTFKPVKSDDITAHKMEEEYYEIGGDVIESLKSTRHRVIAVGTTTCRALETFAVNKKARGWSRLFIYPPYKFKRVDAIITNFHLPRTTLLMLVSAFCGREFLMRAYEEAIKKRYRFYSYGDAMLIL